MASQIQNPMPSLKDLNEDLTPLPKPNVAMRSSASEEPWTDEEVKGLVLNPVFAGIGNFTPASITDREWIVNCVRSIEEEGVKQTLVNILHLLRVSFPASGEGPHLEQGDFSRS